MDVVPAAMPQTWGAKKSAAFGCDSVFRSGAPRSMKVGTIRSLCPYDAAARRALQSASLRRPAILHYAHRGPDIAGRSGYPSFDSGHAKYFRDRRDVHFRTFPSPDRFRTIQLFLSDLLGILRQAMRGEHECRAPRLCSAGTEAFGWTSSIADRLSEARPLPQL
jgi:hypothetical protein